MLRGRGQGEEGRLEGKERENERFEMLNKRAINLVNCYFNKCHLKV